ncbi:MAG TPA: hypothetical protein VLS91_05020 [Acidimicrobiales bacterium]|nr:hypothetical protein [Acidimicrobiales bacterium]
MSEEPETVPVIPVVVCEEASGLEGQDVSLASETIGLDKKYCRSVHCVMFPLLTDDGTGGLKTAFAPV